MSAPIKQYALGSIHTFGDQGMFECEDGDYVLHADHLASHQYVEEKERGLCADAMRTQNEQLENNGFQPLTLRQEHAFVAGWIRCAKSRAKAAGCE